MTQQRPDQVRPDGAQGAWTYRSFDWRELANELAREKRDDQLFREILLRTDGDVEQALDVMERVLGQYGESQDFDRSEFERRLLQEGTLQRSSDGELDMSAKAERSLREHSFETLFGEAMKPGGMGKHDTSKLGGLGEYDGTLRAWRHGDEPGLISYPESFRNSLARGGGWQGRLDLRDEDMVVQDRVQQTSCATVLLLDISHSMTLYGEDRITPAKRVALALTHLITERFPKDDLHLVVFGDDAKEVPLADLPRVSNGPFHTNTQAAMRQAMTILRRKRHPNKRIVMITDGKPTAMHDRGQIYINTFGLDKRVITATLQEAVHARRRNIDVSVFMVADDPYLMQFIRRFCNACRGSAHLVGLDQLGAAVISDFMRRR